MAVARRGGAVVETLWWVTAGFVLAFAAAWHWMPDVERAVQGAVRDLARHVDLQP